MSAANVIWRSWAWEPPVLLGLAVAGLGYGLGALRLWRRAGWGRGLGSWRAAAGGAGLLALFAALVSPLDTAAGALFAAHMAQHLLLVLVAAPLLVLGLPVPVGLWALPLAWRKMAARAWRRAGWLRALWLELTRPAVAWSAATLAFWLWHLPALYQAALRDPLWHGLEHLSLFGSAWLFWWALLGPRAARRLPRGAAVLYLFASSLQGSVLGALLTFSARPWYGDYAARTALFGLTPLQDQQLAGLIMWLPAGLIYTVLAAGFFLAWLEPGTLGAGRQEGIGHAG